jgi:hypothetical protein
LASSIRLRASNGSSVGDSNVFDIQAALPPAGTTTVFAEDFESGALNPAYWASTGPDHSERRLAHSLVHTAELGT